VIQRCPESWMKGIIPATQTAIRSRKNEFKSSELLDPFQKSVKYGIRSDDVSKIKQDWNIGPISICEWRMPNGTIVEIVSWFRNRFDIVRSIDPFGESDLCITLRSFRRRSDDHEGPATSNFVIVQARVGLWDVHDTDAEMNGPRFHSKPTRKGHHRHLEKTQRTLRTKGWMLY
jgi:hypothetical protein